MILPKINTSTQETQVLRKSLGTNKIVIDLQKEYDEDKELIDILNDLCKFKSLNFLIILTLNSYKNFIFNF